MIKTLRLISKGVTVLIICMITSIITFILHDLTTPADFEIAGELSLLAQSYGAKAATILWGFIAFLLISIIYIAYEKNLSGGRARRALLFGGLTGATWLIEMMEMEQSLTNFLMGLVDGAMVILVCLIMAFLISPKRKSSKKVIKVGKSEVLEIIIIALIFATYRLLFGVFLGNYYDGIGDYIIIPIYSMLMGLLWIFLKDMTGGGTHISRAAKYSVMIWGVPSSIFMYFMAFCFANMLIGLTIRNIMDILVMFLSTWLCLKMNNKINVKVT